MNRTTAALAIAFSLMAIPVIPANAVTMVKSSFNSLCGKSAMVLHARITKAVLKPQREGLGPFTCYDLTVIDAMNSKAPTKGRKICYFGDPRSGEKTIVAGLKYPSLDEEGVFLIKALGESSQISPLEGWNQGHFTVKRSPIGGEAVLTASGQAVCAFDDSQRSNDLAGDSANGLTLNSPARPCAPMSVAAFKKRVAACQK